MTRSRFDRLLPLSLAAALLLPVSSAAQDEREDNTPTAAIWLTNTTVTTINSYISQGYRITDLEVDNAAASRFTVCMTHNSGAYRVSGWWWYYGATSSQVSTLLSQNSARPIDIDTYLDSSGNRRYAVVMVSNTGSVAKPWAIFYGSTTSVISRYLSTNGYRLVDFDGYTSGSTRYYAAIAIPNSGGDARAWWWYVGASPSQVNSLLAQNRARLVDLEPVGNGTYDVIMNRVAGSWWWYYGQSASQVTALAQQIGARVVDIERNGSTYDCILTNNSNALTTRISEILRGPGTSGVRGAYLRRIDGGTSTVLAALHQGTQFEPASTMKTLLHAHAMRRVHLGLVNINRTMVTYLGKTGSCPNGGLPSVNESLLSVLAQMMELSDNCRTKTVNDFFGTGSINATAGALGMTRTSLNHVLGCGGPPDNLTTLEDLGRLHDQVADGYLGDEMYRFWELMINDRSYPTVGSLNIDAIITAEAASAGIVGAQLTAFRSHVGYAAKGGNYDYPRSVTYHGSYFGQISLPIVVNGHVVLRRYALGTFFHGGANKTACFDAIGTAYAELLREEIRAALRTWVGAVVGGLQSYGTACPGSSNLSPVMHATGQPEIGERMTYSVRTAPPGAPAVLNFGSSSTSWNGLLLPLDLGFMGAPGCKVLTNQVFSVPMVLDRNGQAALAVNLPDDQALIGRSIYSQFWVVDVGANSLGMTTTIGVRTILGINQP